MDVSETLEKILDITIYNLIFQSEIQVSDETKDKLDFFLNVFNFRIQFQTFVQVFFWTFSRIYTHFSPGRSYCPGCYGYCNMHRISSELASELLGNTFNLKIKIICFICLHSYAFIMLLLILKCFNYKFLKFSQFWVY